MEDNDNGYYAVLGIERTNDRGTIWKGFREVGIKYLPDEDSDRRGSNSVMFSKICEAYEVLSNPELKYIYDSYGEKILKNGLPTESNHPGYAFTGDCYQSFIAALKMPILGEKEEKKKLESKKSRTVPDLVIEVKCTLKELYFGCMKSITYKREKLLHYSGRKTENVTCEKDVQIRPGFADGQEIRFSKEGHDAVGKHTGDLVIKIIQIPHESYKRFGNHLIYKKNITMEQSLLPEPFQIVTLDDRILNVCVSESITQQTATMIKNEGMPIYDLNDYLETLDSKQNKGDLFVKYEIEFPSHISDSQKNKISKILSE